MYKTTTIQPITTNMIARKQNQKEKNDEPWKLRGEYKASLSSSLLIFHFHITSYPNSLGQHHQTKPTKFKFKFLQPNLKIICGTQVELNA